MGQSPNPETVIDFSTEGLPLIQGNSDIKNGKIFSKKNTVGLKLKKCKKDDILFTVRAGVGDVYFADKEACIGRGFCSIRINNPQLNNSKFVYYYLQKYKPKWKQISQGTTFDSINSPHINNLLIPKKSFEEQNFIGEYFSNLDKLIHNTQRELELVENYKKDMLHKIFNQKIRFKDDNGNDYPEWEITKLSNVLTYGNKNRVQDTSKYNKISVKLNLKGLDFFNSKVKLQDTRPFYIRDEGEIIIGKQNLTKGSLAIVEKEFAGCICSNAIMSFKSEINKFIYYYISRDQFLNTVKQHETGSAQKEISEKDFLNLKFSKPSNEEINKITIFFTNLDTEILNLKNSLKSLNDLKKDMLEKMF